MVTETSSESICYKFTAKTEALVGKSEYIIPAITELMNSLKEYEVKNNVKLNDVKISMEKIIDQSQLYVYSISGSAIKYQK
jgi:hypothetical protein